MLTLPTRQGLWNEATLSSICRMIEGLVQDANGSGPQKEHGLDGEAKPHTGNLCAGLAMKGAMLFLEPS